VPSQSEPSTCSRKQPTCHSPGTSTSHDTQHVGIQFGPARSSLKAVTRWALRFGGVIISEPHQGQDGPQTYCHAEFSYYGVTVQVYAFIPATKAST
jgi:hypothetical protein